MKTLLKAEALQISYLRRQVKEVSGNFRGLKQMGALLNLCPLSYTRKHDSHVAHPSRTRLAQTILDSPVVEIHSIC